MKHLSQILFLFHFSLILFPSSAAVPMKWTVDVSRVQPEVRDVVRGETVALEATLQCDGKPFATGPEPVCIFWQTNGMGRLWWSAPASVTNHPITQSSNQSILSATFTPEMDPGAPTVNGFLGSSGSMYRAIFTLRFRHGPGAVPNALPLPTPVIDFSKVTVLNPPWSGGGSGVVDTNSVLDIIHKTVEGSARYTPKYLWVYDCDDTNPEDAAWYYAQPQPYGSCSAVREGGFLYRNYDWRFDDAAEFVVRVSAASERFASIGVANVGTNITEAMATSGKQLPPRYYKALPGRVVDGINENGVVCEVNVVGGTPPASTGGDIHPLAAVRWALDNGTSAEMVASNLAARIAFPACWTQNFHWMVADERETWIVENGVASNVTAVAAKRVMTNFAILNDDYEGEGMERYQLLRRGESITNAWWTLAYLPETSPIRYSDLGTNYESIWERWAEKPREAHRGESSGGQTWWQTVHTSVYDITNRTLRIAVQETDDWYTFAVPSAGGSSGTDTNDVRAIVDDSVGGTNAVKAAVAAVPSLQSSVSSLSSSVSGLSSSTASHASQLSQLSQDKRDKTDNTCHMTEFGEWGNIRSDNAEVDAWLQTHFGTPDCYVELEQDDDGTFIGWRLSGIGAPDGWERFDFDLDFKLGENENATTLGKFDNPINRQFYNTDTEELACVVITRDKFCVRGESFVTKSYVTDSVKVKSVNGETGDVEITPSSIGAAAASDVSALNVGYDRLYRFNTGATNANFSATNYPPTKAEADARCHWRPDPDTDFSDVPSSLQLNEFRDGEWRVVFDSRDWPYWYFRNKEKTLTNEIARLKAENAALSNELENARAWAGRTANGVENPMDDTVVVDRPNLWLMAGYDWAKVVSGSNQCFVIRANNVAMSGGASTNGFLEVLDAFGKPYMRINKSAETFADPVFEDIRFDADEGAWYVVFGNSAKPTRGGANVVIRGSESRTGGVILHGEDEDGCPAVITWPDVPESHANHWIMKAVPKPVEGTVPPTMFFGAEIRVPGSDYVEYLKEASFGAGIRFGANVYDPVESGDQLIWRKRQ